MSDGTRKVLPDFPLACYLFVVGLLVASLLTRRGVRCWSLMCISRDVTFDESCPFYPCSSSSNFHVEDISFLMFLDSPPSVSRVPTLQVPPIADPTTSSPTSSSSSSSPDSPLSSPISPSSSSHMVIATHFPFGFTTLVVHVMMTLLLTCLPLLVCRLLCSSLLVIFVLSHVPT